MSELNHTPRSIRFLELWRWKGWRIKVYGISQHHTTPAQNLLLSAKELAKTVFPLPAKSIGRYAVGFMIIHEADMFHQIIFDWWESVNELRHIVFKSKEEDKHSFENITASGDAFCIWELKVICFERDVWKKLLISPNQDIEAYIKAHINTYE